MNQFGAKPVVLRCSRCGKFVDWDEARVQVICSCRPHLDLPPVLVREATDSDRAAARELFAQDFGRTHIVAFGEVMDIDQMPALVAIMYTDPSGALAYRLLGDALHIVALATDPMWQRSGVGGHLVAEAELLARRRAIAVGRFAHEHRRQIEMRPTRADHLHARLVPVDELAAARTAQHGGLGAELIERHL